MAELSILLTDKDAAAARIAALQKEQRRAATFGDPAKFWSVGISAGSSFNTPLVTGALRLTAAPFKNSFFALGAEVGLLSAEDNLDYFSIFPFMQTAFYLPVGTLGGIYAGAGAGYLISGYTWPEGETKLNIFAVDLIAGFNFWDMLDISYILRTDLENFSSRVGIGFVYRFK